ncbi:MAG: hypothetical protein H8D78_16360 [Chloroflexi bacterium]|nr:hypothetical protein [Chloroflexota bacterium]
MACPALSLTAPTATALRRGRLALLALTLTAPTATALRRGRLALLALTLATAVAATRRALLDAAIRTAFLGVRGLTPTAALPALEGGLCPCH